MTVEVKIDTIRLNCIDEEGNQRFCTKKIESRRTTFMDGSKSNWNQRGCKLTLDDGSALNPTVQSADCKVFTHWITKEEFTID